MPRNPKQEPYGNAYSNSASPANSVPGDRGGDEASAQLTARRRNMKNNAAARGDPNGVEGGSGDGYISRTDYMLWKRRHNNQTTDSNN